MGLVLSVGEKMRKITTTLMACVMKCSNFLQNTSVIFLAIAAFVGHIAEKQNGSIQTQNMCLTACMEKKKS